MLQNTVWDFRDFNPHFPWGKWLDGSKRKRQDKGYFNPHFPWGKWQQPLQRFFAETWFQSTLPLREVTSLTIALYIDISISIHTSPEGSDLEFIKYWDRKQNFNPHFPWGKWQYCNTNLMQILEFQSTLPLREVTTTGTPGILKRWTFQSTLPLREVTRWILMLNNDWWNFNPHFPWGKWLLY